MSYAYFYCLFLYGKIFLNAECYKRSMYVRMCDQFHLIAYLSSFIVSFCDDPFFFFYIYKHKRVIAVARLRVAQPTYGTCPITCTRSSELHLTAELVS